MHRPIAPLFALVLSLSFLPNLLPNLSPAAAAVVTCPSPTIDDLQQRFSQLVNGINQKTGGESLGEFQDLLSQVRSSSNAALRASFLEQVLDGEFPGISVIPLRSLQQAVELEQLGPDRNKPQTDRFIAFVNDLSKIAQSLPAGHSFTKARSLVKLANYAILLGQPQLAPPLLQSAELAATGVQGDVYRGRVLAQVAWGQGIANQPNAAKTLAQASQLYAKPPVKSRSQQLALDIGIAAASLGDEALAQDWIKTINNDSDVYIRQTLVRSALRRKNGPAAMALARRITLPGNQSESLAEISEFYARNASPVTARGILTQAWGKWGNTTENSAPYNLINAAARLGYFDLAIAWVKQPRSNGPSPITHSLILSLAKAQQPEKAGEILDLYLKQIQASPDSGWRSFEVSSWANAAHRAGLLSRVADRWSDLPSSVTAVLLGESFATNYAKQSSIATAMTWTEKLNDRPVDSPFPSKILAVTALADYAYAQQQPAQAQAMLTQLEAQIEPYIQRLKKEGQAIVYVRSEAYTRLARVYGKAGQKAQASRLILMAVKANPDLGNPEFAQPSDNPYSLTMEAQLYDLAYEASQAIAFPEIRLSWMYGAASALAKTKQLEPARAILKQPTIVGFMRADLLLTIAAQEQGKEAIATLQQALTAAQAIPGAESEFDRLGRDGSTIIPLETDRGSTVISVAVGYAKAGQVSQAKAIVAKLKDAENRQDGARLIQEALAQKCS
jgi:tetratricopeptide (TPR) repeat protein